MFYSHSAKGFFSADVHITIPDDAIEIDSETHAALLAGVNCGRVIEVVDGVPVLAAIDPALQLDQLRSAAQAELRGALDNLLRGYTSGVLAEEIAGWGTKAAAARAHLGGETQAVILAEAAQTGEDDMALASLIVEMAEQYLAVISTATGLRRATRDAIAQASTPAEIEAAITNAMSAISALAPPNT